MGKKRDLEDADSISIGREFIHFRYRPYRDRRHLFLICLTDDNI